MDKTGVIYILTNPSFPEYVKIGYADDIDKRLQQLNRSECIPFAFRVYATYEVNSRLSDLKIHSIIDKLNPNLRSIENFNGKQRIREFYAMSPEDAYSILEAIAEIHGCADKLKRIAMDETQKQAEETAQEIDAEHKERQSPFRFSMCGIQPGEEIEYCNNPEIKCTVVDDKTVSYQGQVYSLSALAQLLTGSKYSVAGPRYFKYRGEWRMTCATDRRDKYLLYTICLFVAAREVAYVREGITENTNCFTKQCAYVFRRCRRISTLRSTNLEEADSCN